MPGLWELKMRIEDYGYTMECHPIILGEKYVVNFYEHTKFTHSIIILHEYIESLSKVFPKYKMVVGYNTYFVDTGNTKIGVGTTAPAHKLSVSVKITPPFPLIRV
jgi:hypothetical protein